MYRFNRLFSAAASAASRNRSSRRIVDRKVLPPELSKNVVKLTCNSSAKGGICDVYLIGTVHGYPKSVQDVRAVVKFLKPQVVFLELCSSQSFLVRLLAEIGQKRYEDKFARAPFWQIIKMGLFKISVKFLPDTDDKYEMSSTLLQESTRWHYEPIFIEMVDKRDKYMSAGLLSVAHKHNTVVAVVGKSHLLGIQKYWQQPIEVKRLLNIPQETRKFSYRLKLIVYYISFGVAFISEVLIIYLALLLFL